MSSTPPLSLAVRPYEAQRALILAALGAWTIAVPYLAKALGLVVDVPSRVEIADHVIPGALVVVMGLYLHRLARRRPLAGAPFALPAAGAAFLAGFWAVATHVPLLGDATHDRVTWDAALFHFASALPIVVLACWLILRAISEP